MEKKNFYQMYDHEITKRIQELAVESSKIKTEIFRCSMLNKGLDRSKIHYYLSYINDFLKFWEDYGLDLHEKMKKTKGSENVRTIKYNDVKDYIYANYDYAAVVRFTDNLIHASEDAAINTNDDIDSVFKFGIKDAFDDQADSTAGLLDSVVGESLDREFVTDISEAKYFDSAKSYNFIKSTDRTELYTSTKKIIEFLTDTTALKDHLKFKNVMLFVSSINHIVEFMTYSLTAYATRIYAISQYAYPFIHKNPTETSSTTRPIGESVELPSSGNNNQVQVRIMCDTDDSICRDPIQLKALIKAFGDFTSMIGADSLFGNTKPKYGNYPSSYEMEKNVFSQKLIGNELYHYLTKGRYVEINFRDAKGSDILEMAQMLKSMIYSQQQAVQGVNTPKQEILHVIRGTEGQQTTSGYQELAADLMRFTFQICGNIERTITDLEYWGNSYERNNTMNVGIRNGLNEIAKVLKELYADVASASLMKARDIEDGYNRANSTEMDQILNKLKINAGVSTNVTNAVPDTTRLPIDLLNLYALPAFESMQMYDEFVMNMPEFANDAYFQEGVISDVINQIFSWIQAAAKKFTDFKNNTKVKRGVEWVIKNETELRKIASEGFSDQDKSPACYPFKLNIRIPRFQDSLINGLKEFNDDKLASKEVFTKYIISMYPGSKEDKAQNFSFFNPEITERDFNTKQMKQAYRNLILYIDEVNVKEAKEPQKVIYSGKDLTDHFISWIETVKSLDDAYKAYMNYDKQITDAFTEIKKKVVEMTKNKDNEKKEDNDPGLKAAADGKTAGTPQDQNNQNKNQSGTPITSSVEFDTDGSILTEAEQQVKPGEEKKEENGKVSTDSCMAWLSSLISDVWVPLGSFISFAVYEEYRYLATVYKQKKGTSGNSDNTQNN